MTLLKMNILYLTNHLNTGGITSYVLSLAGGLKARGHNVYVASSQGELIPRFMDAGIGYLPIPIRTKSEVNCFKILPSFFKCSAFIKEKNIGIIHSNTRVTQVLGSLLEYFSDRPHISTCHGFFKQRLSRRLFPCWGKKVIAISQGVKEHLVGDFKVNENDIVVIHNGIDVDKFRGQGIGDRGQGKKELGLGDGPVVGIVARLSDVKGHIYLIEAMPAVFNKVPDAQLLIAGEGKMKGELAALGKRLGIAQSIFFVPSVNDTRMVYRALDLFVLPSLKEGLGLALMEAMAFGLPCIGSDVGGIKDLIKDKFNGLLIKPGDSRGLSEAILKLLLDKEEAFALGERARVFISEKFSLRRMVLETEKAYLECVNKEY